MRNTGEGLETRVGRVSICEHRGINVSSSSLKIIAIITMLIDHIGLVFYPDIYLFRIIGRISMPIFSYQIAVGYDKTSNIKDYIKRLFIMALVAQYPYTIVINKYGLNVIFTLMLGLISIYILKNYDFKISIIGLTLIFYMAEYLNLNYGMYGILMIILFNKYYENKKAIAISFIILNLIFYKNFNIQIFSILSLIFIMLYNGKKGKIKNKNLFYIIYPLHLIIIYIVKNVLINI